MCVFGDAEVCKSDGYVEKISNLKVGDFVKTLDGDKIIEDIFEYDNCDVLEIEMEDGEIIKCTPNHKFLVKENWSSDEDSSCWKCASDLKDNDIILAIEQ